jgi:hypothetical protein
MVLSRVRVLCGLYLTANSQVMPKHFSWIFVLIVFFSCKKDNPGSNTGDSYSFDSIFNQFCTKMESRYLFWDIDTINWDRIYYRYTPLFKKLDINSETDNRRAFQYFSEITAPIVDGHFSITFSNPYLSNFIIYPSYQKKQDAGFFPINHLMVDSTYLDTDYSFGFDPGTVINGKPLYAICGTIDQEIIYFSCNYFRLYDYYSSPQDNPVKRVVQRLFDLLLRQDFKGIIIDVRNNPGGDIKDLNFLVGHLTTTKHAFGFSKYKIGNGRLDFTPWIQSFINPVSGAIDFGKAKVVLTDRYSASLSELVAMAVRSLPNSSVVGDTTWGATAFITNSELYNAGTFEIKDFMTVNIASGAFKYIDYIIYEGVGFPPDHQIGHNASVPNSGKDIALEKSIEIIKLNP